MKICLLYLLGLLIIIALCVARSKFEIKETFEEAKKFYLIENKIESGNEYYRLRFEGLLGKSNDMQLNQILPHFTDIKKFLLSLHKTGDLKHMLDNIHLKEYIGSPMLYSGLTWGCLALICILTFMDNIIIRKSMAKETGESNINYQVMDQAML